MLLNFTKEIYIFFSNLYRLSASSSLAVLIILALLITGRENGKINLVDNCT